MRFLNVSLAGATTLAVVSGCAAPPMGPTVNVMPAPNEPFEVFEQDQTVCKQYAGQQIAGQAQAANQQAVGTAVVGTLLGAGLGAAVGGGRGAAVGASSGAIVGTGVGAGTSQGAQGGIQAQYDNAYAECMYAKGDQVPGFAPPQPAPAPPPSP